MKRFFSLLLGMALVALSSGCGGGGSGVSVPTARSSAVVFVSQRGAVNTDIQLYRMNADGSNLTRLTDSADGKGSPHLSRDGKTIVYTSVDGTSGTVVSNIRKLNGDGTGAVQLTSDGASYDAAISPNGQTIVWVKRGELWMMDVSGRNQRLLSRVYAPYIGPTFSPDGTALAAKATQNGQDVLVVRTLSSGREQVIAPSRRASALAGVSVPHYSPDGKHLIFCAAVAPNRGGIYPISDVLEIKADGSDAQAPTTLATDLDSVGNVLFNPDNGSLLIQTYGPDALLSGQVTGFQLASVSRNNFKSPTILTSLGTNYDASFAD